MGHKKVCLKCRKAFNIQKHIETDIKLVCPNCGGKTILFDHKFRPPKQNNVKDWKMVEYLKDHGFIYQHIYKNIEKGLTIEVEYPKNMEEAKTFVEKYKSQAYQYDW